MVFYNATTKQGICQEIDRLCDSDDTSYPRLDKTSRVNNSAEQVVGWVINADGTAQFDDTNYTNFPIGTYTMVASQGKYSFNDKFLQMMNVQVKNANGDWVMLNPIDQSERDGVLEEDFETPGMPEYYDKLSDDTIKLYPAPSAAYTTVTLGLRIYFKRTFSLFTAVSTTAADATDPGFASPYHIILAYMSSIPYCMTYKKDRVGLYEKKVMDLKAELINHYSQREKDKRKQITFESTPWR